MYADLVDLEKLENGNLKVTLTEEGRSEIIDSFEVNKRAPDLYVLMEHHLCNGWTALNPEDIGALTGCEDIYTDDYAMDDEGGYEYIGRVYWYPQYETKNPVIELLRHGFIILEGVEE